MSLKLSTRAKKNGFTCRYARRLFKTGQLLLPVTQLTSGPILVQEAPAELV